MIKREDEILGVTDTSMIKREDEILGVTDTSNDKMGR